MSSGPNPPQKLNLQRRELGPGRGACRKGLQRRHFLLWKHQDSRTWETGASPGLYPNAGGESKTTAPDRRKASLPWNEPPRLFLVGTQSVRVLPAQIGRSLADINVPSIYLQLNPTGTGWTVFTEVRVGNSGPMSPSNVRSRQAHLCVCPAASLSNSSQCICRVRVIISSLGGCEQND